MYKCVCGWLPHLFPWAPVGHVSGHQRGMWACTCVDVCPLRGIRTSVHTGVVWKCLSWVRCSPGAVCVGGGLWATGRGRKEEA